MSEKLSELVLGGDNPVVGPNSARELRAFASEPEPALIAESELDTMIGKLALATAQPKLSKDEAAERMRMYWIALRDLPVSDLRAAFVDILRTSTFLPTPAEIRTVAIKAGALRRYAKSRAKHLVWLHERDWRPTGEHIPPEELHALLADLKIGNEA